MRSAQAFDVQTDRGAAIRRALGSLASDDEAEFPRIDGLATVRGDIVGIAHVSKTHRDGVEEHIACRFKFLVDRRRLYLAGRKDARDIALNEFETLGALDGLITPHTLDNEHVAQGILERLRRQHRGNFIRRLRMQFGVAGIDYHNATPLYRLEYQLVRDTCASTHRSFDEFVRAAMQVNATFGIVQLLDRIVRTDKGDSPASLNVSPNSSVSCYMDLEEDAWYDILDYLL